MILTEIQNYDNVFSNINTPFVNILIKAFRIAGKENTKRIVESILKRRLLSKIEYVNNLLFFSNMNNM